MLPGRKYSPEDLLDIVRRRFWFLVVPFAVVSAATAVVARTLPDMYLSQALVSVVPQQVPQSFVTTTVTTSLSDRLRAIQDQVLSRPRLEKLILDLNLYSEERRTGIMADVVQRMKGRDLLIYPAGPVALRVSYVGREPITTQKVAEQIASAIIAESLADRSRVADQTNTFLETELETVRQGLLATEQRYVAYRRQHAGELPTQVDLNLRAAEGKQMQVQSILAEVNAARQRRILLDRQLADEKRTPVAAGVPFAAPAPVTPGRGGVVSGSTIQTLADARLQLEALSARYNAVHPEVVKWTALVKQLEAKAAAEATGSLTARGLPAGVSPAEALRASRIEEIENQIQENDVQNERYQAEVKRLREEAAAYLARAEAGPTREAELTELLRDYTVLQNQFTGLKQKSEAAKLSANLERREIGEQFRLLEPARVPERPDSPHRRQINLFGMIAGLGIGIAVLGFLEYRDSGFKTDEEVTAVLGLPVLAVVPVMQSEPERRRTLVWKLVLHVGLGSAVAGCLAVLAYTFVR